MKFIFISEPTFEPWDWRNPELQGIGGSETSHIEMARRIVQRGHEVLSYAPVPFEGVQYNQGVRWEHYSGLDVSQSADIWVVYRAPQVIDGLPEGEEIWLVCQDVDYNFPGRTLTQDRLDKVTRIVALCEEHGSYLRARYPSAAHKVCVSSNGIKSELISVLLRNAPARNPKRLMYASSPDRGMEFLLDIFPRAKEIMPDLELHVYYGFDNIEKIKVPWVRTRMENLKALLNQPGVVNHGRIGQTALLREWLQSAIWCHPSDFTETSCITCMDAQACGAIPITHPVWAVAENVKHGVFIDGSVTKEIIRSRYVLEVIKLAADAERQESIRRDMMPWALEHFDWNHFVNQWLGWAAQPARNELEQESVSA